MIGFGASLLIPSEPIGFFGLLGVWGLLDILLPKQKKEREPSR
jgi:hypothetical protein